MLYKHNKICAKNKLSVLDVSPEQLNAEFDRNSRCSKSESYIKTAFWLNKFIKYLDSMEGQILLDYDSSYIDTSTLSTSQKDQLLLIAQKQKQFLSTIYNSSFNKDQETEYINSFQDSYSQLLSPIFNTLKLLYFTTMFFCLGIISNSNQ